MNLGFFMSRIWWLEVCQLSVLYTERNGPWLLKIIKRKLTSQQCHFSSILQTPDINAWLRGSRTPSLESFVHPFFGNPPWPQVLCGSTELWSWFCLIPNPRKMLELGKGEYVYQSPRESLSQRCPVAGWRAFLRNTQTGKTLLGNVVWDSFPFWACLWC